jgi:S-DNA-T family DNA segregation ATPase FtsK/SpoIIIE
MKKVKVSDVVFIFLSIIIFLSLFTYNFNDVFYPHYRINNVIGLLGMYISNFSLNRFGLFAYYLPILFLLAPFSYNKSKAKFARSIMFGLIVMFLGDIIVYALYGASRDHLIMHGYFNCGVFGYIFGDIFSYLLGNIGIFIVIIPLWLTALYFSLMEFFAFFVVKINDYQKSDIKKPPITKKNSRIKKMELIKRFVSKKMEEQVSYGHFVKNKDENEDFSDENIKNVDGTNDKKSVEDSSVDSTGTDSQKEQVQVNSSQKELIEIENQNDKTQENDEEDKHSASGTKITENQTEDINKSIGQEKTDASQLQELSIDTEFLDKKKEIVSLEQKSESGYSFPSLELLDEPVNIEANIQEDEIYRSAQVLKDKLKHFGVDGEVVNVKPGPVITMYEFRPKSGIKISKISNLYNDLAMAMRAMSVRIIAPIPGKAVVGIEISNKNRQTVFMKDILSSKTFAQSKSRLTLALGKDIVGNPFVADLAKMPHLLIAGATGSGKSVSVNTMILSILYKSTPDEVRFVMIDPKMLELSIYDGIPHMLMPVVVDPKEANGSLAALVSEMETRYKMMSEVGVRNIDGFNVKARNGTIDYPVLPYIVVVIDELADLMMVSGKKVETHIARLAQMARAAGIHMIVATQRPSVDVLTGLIKANFPARISFKVSSKIDSRTILDAQGAEALLGRGDMLFMQPGSSSLVRIHGAFVGDDEIKRITDFVKTQGEPVYNEELINATKEASGVNGDDDFETDELFDEALKIIQEGGNPTISYIQRKLRIGYNRAATIIEQMEKKGILSKPDERNRREILI